jgi:hypothetical protein
MITREQAHALVELRRNHNVVSTYESRLSPPRLFVYLDDPDYDGLDEVVVFADGRVLWS